MASSRVLVNQPFTGSAIQKLDRGELLLGGRIAA